MANSPSIILRERDDSAFAITTSNTVLAVVGYATKGPIGKVVELTSRNEFRKKFGQPPTNAPWAHLAVYRAFAQGNRVLYYRVAETEGENAATASEIVVNNAQEASAGYQAFSRTSNVSFGEYVPREIYDFRVAVDGGDTRPVYITSPVSGDWTLANIAGSINTQLASTSFAFQEFEAQNNPIINVPDRELRFKLSVDGDNMVAAGASVDEFSVFLDSGDTLADIATKMTTAVSAGTHGYHRIDIGDSVVGTNVVGLNGTYNLGYTIDSGSAQVATVTINPNTTWAQLATLLEAEVTGARVFLDQEATSLLRFQSNTNGVGSTVSITAGATEDLIAALNAETTGTTELVSPVAGKDGTVATDTYSIAVNSATGRIRVSSLNGGSATDPELSAVAITPSAIGWTTFSLANLLRNSNRFPSGTGILAMNSGFDAVSATSAVVQSRIRVISDSIGTTPVLSQILLSEGIGVNNRKFYGTNGLTDVLLPVNGVDGVEAWQTDNVLFRAKEKGSETNNVFIQKTSETNPATGEVLHAISVLYNDNVEETFTGLSLNESDDNFFVTAINNDPSNGGSAWIEVEYEDNDQDGVVDLDNGTYRLGDETHGDAFSTGDGLSDYGHRVGTDGVPSIGGAAMFADALSTDGDLANQELYDFHILVTPDNNSELTQSSAIDLAEFRKDFIYIVDPPFGLSYNQVTEWHNGQGGFGRSVALNSSFAATYWPWLKENNPATREQIWSPPSVFLAAKYMEIDRRFGPWLAVAGDTRGRVVAFDYETSPSKPQRDFIYGGLNAVNPVVNFTSKGLIIYGQKTLLRQTTALNRVNVRRMLIYVSKLIRKAMEGMVFEPHNPASWDRAANMVNAILDPVRQEGGIDDYRVTIDASTNTQDVIQQGIMKGIIQIVPVGTIEVIDLTVTLLSPGATIS